MWLLYFAVAVVALELRTALVLAGLSLSGAPRILDPSAWCLLLRCCVSRYVYSVERIASRRPGPARRAFARAGDAAPRYYLNCFTFKRAAAR